MDTEFGKINKIEKKNFFLINLINRIIKIIYFLFHNIGKVYKHKFSSKKIFLFHNSIFIESFIVIIKTK